MMYTTATCTSAPPSLRNRTNSLYSIPKGSTVLANHWSIHMDPDVYPNPEAFDPDRFIKNGKLVGTKYSDKGHHGFGFGRRICPGCVDGMRPSSLS